MTTFNKIFSLILILAVSFQISAQKSILQEENNQYKKYQFKTEKEWDEFNRFRPTKNKTLYGTENTDLTKIVFGWNPYWMGTAYQDFNFSLLSDVSYFSYEVDPNTGLPADLHYWKTTELVDYAHNNNCKVSLTITLFSGHATFFSSTDSKQALIDTVIKLIQYRNADGVNLDIEAVPADQKDPMTAFVQNFCEQFHNAFPEGQVSLDLPAVNWDEKFDVAQMKNFVDLFLIMGYDYHWSSSDQAGPVAPKNNGEIWSAYDVTRSVNYYLEKGIPPEKLALAVPYYGRDWSTSSSSVPSSTTGSSESKTYKTVREEMESYQHYWDMNASVPYITYQDGGSWHQCWFDNEYSLADKYDLVKMKNLAGIGIWALGYDGAYTNLWDMLSEKFRIDGAKLGYGIFTDMGGPRGDYFNNDNYIFTIAPIGATQIKLYFDEFSTIGDEDILTIYDGDTTSGSIIAEFSGNLNITDTITANSGIMTFHFVSNSTDVSSGWYARWANNEYFLSTEEEKLSNIQNFTVFPNPVKNQLFLELETINTEELTITINDISGAIIAEKTIKIHQGKNTLDISNLIDYLKTGNYFISINNSLYKITKKILIIK